MKSLTSHQLKDIRLIATFLEVYCSGKHSTRPRNSRQIGNGIQPRVLCDECADFMAYAHARRICCPLEQEKPSCKHCRIHCYAPHQRTKIKEVMAYSGKKLILRGRLDYLWHYFF